MNWARCNSPAIFDLMGSCDRWTCYLELRNLLLFIRSCIFHTQACRGETKLRFRVATLKKCNDGEAKGEQAGAREILALCVEYICDTYDARCGLNLQADSGYTHTRTHAHTNIYTYTCVYIYTVDYKVVENLRQAGPNVISEVTHEFIGYFFVLTRFLNSLVSSVFLAHPLRPSAPLYFHLLPYVATYSWSRVPIW